MLKPDLEKVVEQYKAAARYAVEWSRHMETGRCRMCKAERGVQHQKSCHLWPLIDARIEHEMADRQDPNEVESLNELQRLGQEYDNG